MSVHPKNKLKRIKERYIGEYGEELETWRSESVGDWDLDIGRFCCSNFG
jgi:hypothetical protein